MLEAVTIEVEGKSFQLNPMPVLEARKWDFKIMQLIAPLLRALDGQGEKKAAGDEEVLASIGKGDAPQEELGNISFGNVAGAIQEALQSLTDEQVDALLRGLFKRVTWLPGDGVNPPTLLDSEKNINAAFDELGPSALYRLVFEVAKYNKFTPFALAGAGGPIPGILGSLRPGSRKGLDLGRLATSTT